ncbi:MAG: RAMP superfamily CRISPR-associated protein [Candidatus Sumerlaeaceae bacterium]|nr:RAMP superfamily CRISPR-associated protein [Candidatus Sumerlaeaceae bacterium]
MVRFTEKGRSIKARWIITADLILETAAHFGGDEDWAADMMVLRDPKTGKPLLPGTSIAGALRSHLSDLLLGYFSNQEPSEVTQLFGGSRGDNASDQSPLIVFDSIGEIPEGMSFEIRDGVAIDPQWGIAESHKKFDFEVLPPGTRFPLRFELIISETDGEGMLLTLLAEALDGLTFGDIAMGLRRSRGLGKLKGENWRAARYDLSNAYGWLSWILSNHETPFSDQMAGHRTALDAITKGVEQRVELCNRPKDLRKRLVIEATLEIIQELIVRSPNPSPIGPDVKHIHSGGRPVLPGTSLAGVLRAHALRIARLVRKAHGDGDIWIEDLFGPRLNHQSPQACASRLRISDSSVDGAETRCRTRIAIDRFTGGVAQGALFQEGTEEGGCVVMRLEVRNPKQGEIGLLLLLLRDLLAGFVPLGGSSSVGRGFVRGTAKITLPDATDHYVLSNLGVNEETAKCFNHYITEFWAAPKREISQSTGGS